MNSIKRIAAAGAISAAVLAPATGAAVAYAEPYPWHESDSAPAAVKSKAQVEYEERLGLERSSGGGSDTSATSTTVDTGIAWDTVGLAAFAGAAVGAGTVIVVRRFAHAPKQA